MFFRSGKLAAGAAINTGQAGRATVAAQTSCAKEQRKQAAQPKVERDHGFLQDRCGT